MAAKVKKAKARPMRTLMTATDDHPVGLWVDKELLRKHTQQQQTPRTLFTETRKPQAIAIWNLLTLF